MQTNTGGMITAAHDCTEGRRLRSHQRSAISPSGKTLTADRGLLTAFHGRLRLRAWPLTAACTIDAWECRCNALAENTL